MNKSNLNFAFFGTDEFAVAVLDELKKFELIPNLIVTTPDTKKGRGLILTPPPVKTWAQENKIEFLQPEKLNSEFSSHLQLTTYNLFLVASYGKIIPKSVLEIPKHGALNIHPSLLPKLRGPSPLQTAILEENETGVTIIKLDEKMDHGPIVAQKKINFDKWPPSISELSTCLAREGAKLFAKISDDWVSGKIKPKPQDETCATYTKKIRKEDGLINLLDNPETSFRKIQAYAGWPGTFFFDSGKRIIIKKARLENNKLIIEKVLFEGNSKETDWKS